MQTKTPTTRGQDQIQWIMPCTAPGDSDGSESPIREKASAKRQFGQAPVEIQTVAWAISTEPAEAQTPRVLRKVSDERGSTSASTHAGPNSAAMGKVRPKT